MNGFEVITIKSKDGIIDLKELEKVLDDTVAALMLTNPNTLGYMILNTKNNKNGT